MPSTGGPWEWVPRLGDMIRYPFGGVWKSTKTGEEYSGYNASAPQAGSRIGGVGEETMVAAIAEDTPAPYVPMTQRGQFPADIAAAKAGEGDSSRQQVYDEAYNLLGVTPAATAEDEVEAAGSAFRLIMSDPRVAGDQACGVRAVLGDRAGGQRRHHHLRPPGVRDATGRVARPDQP